jgi:hypothetical protein
MIARNESDDDADDESLEERVLATLRKSGYPLELRVAAELRRTGAYYVAHTRHYVDKVTKKVREIDVVACWRAERRDHTVYVYLVIECKNKPSPWVVFEPDDEVSDLEELFDGLYVWDYNGADAWTLVSHRDFSTEGTFLAPGRIGRSFVDPMKKKSDAPDGAFMAVQAAISAVEGFHQDIDLSRLKNRPSIVVSMPVVVTSGVLFLGGLGDDGDIHIVRTDFAEVGSRPGLETAAKRCVITNEAGLPNLVAAVVKTAGALLPD